MDQPPTGKIVDVARDLSSGHAAIGALDGIRDGGGALIGLIATLGLERLDEVGELRFSLAFERPGAVDVHAWSWAPASNRVTRWDLAAGPVSFLLGAPRGPVEQALEAAFLEDSFWLAPHLHVRWAGTSAELVDLGAARLDGRDVRWTQLRYTLGDTHDLYVDEGGRIVGWRLQRAGAVAVAATFEDYGPVGPLQLARVRSLPDGTRVVARDLDWTPTATALSVDPEGLGVFATLRADRCEIGPLTVPRKALPLGAGPIPAAAGPADRRMVLRTPTGRAVHGWSSETLDFSDPAWLVASGWLTCDLWTVDEAELRAALAACSAEERAALVAVVFAWSRSVLAPPPAAAPLVRRVQATAEDCAATARCDPLLEWVARAR